MQPQLNESVVDHPNQSHKFQAVIPEHRQLQRILLLDPQQYPRSLNNEIVSRQIVMI